MPEHPYAPGKLSINTRNHPKSGALMAPQAPSWQTLLGMGAVNAALLVVGIALGWLVDSMLNTDPIFTLVGVALGIVADIVYTTVQFRQFLKN